MGGDNSGKQPAPAPIDTGSAKPSKPWDQNQTPFNMPQPPLPGMDPKPRPVPEMPELESPVNPMSSLNYLSTHPDAMRSNTVACCCGLPVRMDGDDWYTEIYNGTVRCVQCSFCARCGIDCVINCRQQVSMGGHVLCYKCVKLYGDKKFNEHVPMPPIVRHPKNKGSNKSGSGSKKRRGKQPGTEQSEAHNICVSDSNQNNWWQSTRSPECRSLVRYRDYPRPVKYVPELDPTRYEIGFYAATRPEFSHMTCPLCKETATGKEAYVVPGISLVYHRKCFFCLGCKSPLCTGVKRAGVHFVFCNCTPPMQWCTKLACTRKRIEHHATYKCFLEPIHPGGREQNDTRILFMENLNDKKDKRTKKKAAATDASHDDEIAAVNQNDTPATSASNMISGWKTRGQQQYLKLIKPSKPPVKNGRLLLPSPASGTPAPSVTSSSGSPQFSTAVAAAPPVFFRPGQQQDRGK